MFRKFTDLDKARDTLRDKVWHKPPHYAGFSPDGDYCIYTRHRDSEILSESNWCAIEELFKIHSESELEWYAEDRSTLSESPAKDDRPAVYAWRASHFLVGWVEYLMVRADAPLHTLLTAAAIVDALEGYPILNEDDYGERQLNSIYEYWRNCSLKERIEYCKERDVSIFAARRNDDVPEPVFDRLRDMGEFV